MDISRIALTGMDQAQARVERAASRLAGLSQPNDTVDLSSEMVALLQAPHDFAANAQVAKTGDQMQKYLLDVLA